MNRGNVYWRMFKVFTISWALFYLTESCNSSKRPQIDFTPLYKDAIKAVDPLEILKKGVGSPSDRAEF